MSGADARYVEVDLFAVATEAGVGPPFTLRRFVRVSFAQLEEEEAAGDRDVNTRCSGASCVLERQQYLKAILTRYLNYLKAYALSSHGSNKLDLHPPRRGGFTAVSRVLVWTLETR